MAENSDDFNIDKLNSFFNAIQEDQEFEQTTRDTLLKFLELPLEEEMKFNVMHGEGEIYVQRMRTMLSRAKRAYSEATGKEPVMFKMVLRSIERGEMFDIVTLHKTQSKDQVVFEMMYGALERKPK